MWMYMYHQSISPKIFNSTPGNLGFSGAFTLFWGPLHGGCFICHLRPCFRLRLKPRAPQKPPPGWRVSEPSKGCSKNDEKLQNDAECSTILRIGILHFFLWCFIYGNFKGGKYFPHRHSFLRVSKAQICF